MFKKISIQNFRGIKDLTIDDFGKVNLLVGKNNSCKTSVLEALYISLGPNNPLLFHVANSLRGLTSIKVTGGASPNKQLLDGMENSLKVIFYNLNFENNISIETNFKDSKEKREIIIKPIISTDPRADFTQTSLSISTEVKKYWKGLDFIFSRSGLDKKNKNKKIQFESQALLEINTSPSNSQVIDQQLVQLRAKLSDKYIKILEDNKLKEINGRIINHNFSNDSFSSSELEGAFNTIKQKKKKIELIKVLQKIEPKIQDIDFTDSFIVDIGLDEMIRLETLGQGTIKLFYLACILMADEQNIVNGVLFIDEIENGLHYTAQNIVWEFLFDIAKEKNIQIFATTHSEDCELAFVEEAKKRENKDDEKLRDIKLFRLEKEQNDKIKIRNYNFKSLSAWSEEPWEIR